MNNSYAIPTKGWKMQVLPLETIDYYVDIFKRHAASHPKDTFNVVAIGCGLAGYSPAEIAPMFAGRSANVRLPDEFTAVLKGM